MDNSLNFLYLTDVKDKFILDACCGGKMFWFDKNNPNVLFIDKRVCEKGHNPYRKNHEVKPTIVMDFRNLQFEDKSFKLVVFDPPHLKTKSEVLNSAKLYGTLNPDTWESDIKKGFEECYRVLDDYGVLIFKWNESSIKIKKVLEILSIQPLFGNKQGTKLNTHWLCFMKIPKVVPQNNFNQ